MSHKFPYKWYLKDGYPAKGIKDNGLKVFGTFICGGGSTMGYKLAGYDVIGCNEIDPKMMEAYRTNHNPKYSYLEPIQEFKLRKDLPKELYNLDILDGSPPCSSFSIAGNREKDWGKKKKFREGQAEQVLDNLFFDFIDLAKELQPKIVVAENVKGILLGNAVKYVTKIHKEFEKAGYHCQHFLLDAAKMGVPQTRKRVFFICTRKDILKQLPRQFGLFNEAPELKLKFNEPKITFKEIEDITDVKEIESATEASRLWEVTSPGDSFSKIHKKGYYFGCNKVHPNCTIPTIIADLGSSSYHHSIKRVLNDLENKRASTFPIDYIFGKNKVKYIAGMSVPPVMMAQVATEIYNQWLSKLKQ